MASADPTVKNLIFDLGGVILDLAIDDTIRSFATLAGVEHPVAHSWYHSATEFLTYEMGKSTDADFRAFINDYAPTAASHEVIDASWNKMPRAIPKKKLDLVLSLKDKYNEFLLSNTNSIQVK